MSGFPGKAFRSTAMGCQTRHPLSGRGLVLLPVRLATTCAGARPALSYQPECLGRCHGIPGGLTSRRHETAERHVIRKPQTPGLLRSFQQIYHRSVPRPGCNMFVEERSSGKLWNFQLCCMLFCTQGIASLLWEGLYVWNCLCDGVFWKMQLRRRFAVLLSH